jgi:Holliday junction DNA helicase RuvA
MYEFLEGRVAMRAAARLVLDVGGVGYDLAVPLGSGFPADGPDQPVRAWVHLVVRDDAHELYGFADRETRGLFRALLTVSGVGPRVALGVLSGIPREELLAALLSEDVARLTSIKGIGKKTAEQILLDLRDKARALSSGTDAGEGAADEIPRPYVGAREHVEDAVRALTSIGYSEKEARRQVQKAVAQVGPEDLEQLVRAAIGGS